MRRVDSRLPSMRRSGLVSGLDIFLNDVHRVPSRAIGQLAEKIAQPVNSAHSNIGTSRADN
jgi:hypothetical protein